MAKPTISEPFTEAAKKLRAEVEYIRSTSPLPGDKGTEVEDILKAFLNQHWLRIISCLWLLIASVVVKFYFIKT